MPTINGQKIMSTEPIHLMDYLTTHKYRLDRIAIELNGQILPKKDYQTSLLHHDDIVEIVTFMGGG